MKIKSQLVTQMSGSIGGLTGSHNRGGMYLRARSLVTNPNTAQQQAVRNSMATLTGAWNNSLTQLQRDAWADYAANVAVTDRLGEPRFLTALNWYIACNVPRLQASLARIDVAPGIFTLAALSPPAITSITAATDVMIITFTATDLWDSAATGALAVFTSRPQNPSVKFFDGPYRFAGRVLGATTPTTSPQNITLAFPIVAAQKVFVQFRALNPDGRISAPFRLSGVGV